MSMHTRPRAFQITEHIQIASTILYVFFLLNTYIAYTSRVDVLFRFSVVIIVRM